MATRNKKYISADFVGTEAVLSSVNPILKVGEKIQTTDTKRTKTNRSEVETAWNDLPFDTKTLEYTDLSTAISDANSIKNGDLVVISGKRHTVSTDALTEDNVLVYELASGKFVIKQVEKLTPEVAGAIGDGTANDSTAITNLIAAANTNNRPIELEKLNGVYNLSGGTIDFGGAKIVGKGARFKNGTIQNAIIEVDDYTQIFDTDVTIEKSCRTKHITPNNFGAVSNDNTTTYANPFNAALQAAYDSPFTVKIPNGNYYHDGTAVIFNKPKTVICEGYHTTHNLSRLSQHLPQESFEQDNVIIYTDQNVSSLFICRSREVFWKGGLIDVTAVPDTASDMWVLRYDLNFEINRGCIDWSVWGETQTGFPDYLPTMVQTVERWVGGVKIDKNDFDAIGSNGYVQLITFKGYYGFIDRVLYIDAGDVNEGDTTYCTTVDTHFTTFGCKQSDVRVSGGVDSTINGVFQTSHVLMPSQKDDACVVASKRCVYNCYIWDNKGDERTVGGFNGNPSYTVYRTKWAMEVLGEDNKLLSNMTLQEARGLIRYNRTVPRGHVSLETPYSGFLHNDRVLAGFLSPIITAMHNSMLTWDLEYGVTINAYKGVAFDTDVNLDQANEAPYNLTPTNDVTINNPSLLMNLEGGATDIEITNDTDQDNDFVEIVFGDGVTELPVPREIGIFLYEKGLSPNHIQFIEVFDNGTFESQKLQKLPLQNLTASNKNQYRITLTSDIRTTVKLIIRFIGFTGSTTGTLSILDIAGSSNLGRVNFLSKRGNETIIGQPNFRSGVSTRSTNKAEIATLLRGKGVPGQIFNSNAGYEMRFDFYDETIINYARIKVLQRDPRPESFRMRYIFEVVRGDGDSITTRDDVFIIDGRNIHLNFIGTAVGEGVFVIGKVIDKPTVSGTNTVELFMDNKQLFAVNEDGDEMPVTFKHLSNTGSPIGTVTPNYVGQSYRDTDNNAKWESVGLTNTDWILTYIPEQTGTGSPVGSVTPYVRGQKYFDTTSGTPAIWEAYGTTNTEWLQIS